MKLLFNRTPLIVYFFTLTLAWSVSCVADNTLLIIVKKSNPIEQLTKEQVRDIHLGRLTTFPDTNMKVIPLELKERSIQKTFYKNVANKNLRWLNSYWARYAFTGKATPPEKLATPASILDMINSSEQFLGYIEAEQLTDDVKVVYIINSD